MNEILASVADGGKVKLLVEMRKFRRRAVDVALTRTEGNQTEAARRLGIGRSTLLRWMRIAA